ncbi:MAG: TOBE domain-containing protein [Thermomicrobiales bacterium]
MSARNQIKGTVTKVEIGVVTAEITVDIGNGNEIVSVIPKGSAERLGLKVGDAVAAVLKATDVMIGKLDS